MSYMNGNEFREFGKAAIEFIIDYYENIRERDVLPSVEPGYLHSLLPKEMPIESEHWKDIMEDLNNCIMPGITHWQSPNFHAFYPTQTSYPAIIGEMVVGALGVVGFNWLCSPAATELEVIMIEWLGKFLNIPEKFHASTSDHGGGIFQGSASESILLAIMTAREQKVTKVKAENPRMSDGEIRGKLVAYGNIHANSAVEKAGLLSAVKMRLLNSDANGALRGECLKKQVEEDIAAGLIPTICVATIGATGTCSTDYVDELAAICNDNEIWLHVDCAYAGSAFCLPEYKYLMKGLEQVDSLNVNLHKWLLVTFDCTAMWMKESKLVRESFDVERIYLDHEYKENPKAPDFRHWQISLGRRFRALRVWFTLRTYGQEKIREFLRNHISLAKRFENLARSDERFEVVQSVLGLVCFRLKGDCCYTKKLLEILTKQKKIYMIPATYRDQFVARFVVCGFDPKESDIDYAWNQIKSVADKICTANGECGLSGDDSKSKKIEFVSAFD